uniref:Uncharacterized protein n=1 Tax=Arundo donax TaxID=35708 RepID=A0A0A9BRY5_ARUDO
MQVQLSVALALTKQRTVAGLRECYTAIYHPGW